MRYTFKNKFLYVIERALYGKIMFQPFFESLHRIGIRGMNYMQSQAIGQTGEVGAMKYALKIHGKDDSIVLFDVGANEGQFARSMAEVYIEPFQIYSFEPSEAAFDRLTCELFAPNIKCFNFGFGAKERQTILYNSGELIGTTYPLDNTEGGKESISIKTIDDFCFEENINEIFYLKIDVEGGELDVLSGCKRLLNQGKIRFIQFEFGPNSMKAKVYLKDFFEILKKYKIYRIVKNGLRPLKYNEILEIPLTSNFLAELNK